MNMMALIGKGTEGGRWAIWHHPLLEQKELRSRFRDGVLLSRKL